LTACPAATVILPAYNREDSLRRALCSVLRQTLEEFECIVVDDASESDLRAVVESCGDARLRYVRRSVNGGPYAARFTGLKAARAPCVLFLDSDWELYPWALRQACRHFEQNPRVDMICALHVHSEDGRLFVRVRDAPRVVTPDEARREPPIPDRVVAVRSCVVEEWLQKRDDYFALEAHQFLTAKIRHLQLYIDEPWTLYHTSEPGRVTSSMSRARALDDYVRFLEEHRALIDDPQSYMLLDELLKDAYFALWRARRGEAAYAASCLRARSLSPRLALLEVAIRRISGRLPALSPSRTIWA
jgi:glycosyltransferase involved in cell wall biosynthesis